jgi:hypothetical protein
MVFPSRRGNSDASARRRIVRPIVALLVLGCASTVAAVPGQAYTAKVEPAFLCNMEGQAAARAAGESVRPPSGAAVVAGSPVSLSAESPWPLTFAVASSPALLSSPDIDSGAGALQPAGSSPESAPGHTYTFTSTKATTTPGTIYWAASISSNSIPICAGLPAESFTTPTQMLTVLPASPMPVPSTPTSAPPPPAPPIALSLVGKPGLDPKGVTFTVTCEAPTGQSCEGTSALSSSELLVGRRIVGLSATRRRSTKRVAIGNTTFTAAAGQTRTVVVTLDATAHNLLARLHKLPATLTVTLTNAATGVRVVIAKDTVSIVTLDTPSIERMVEQSILSRRHIHAKVTCPTVVIKVIGNNFTCTVTTTVGKGKHQRHERTPFTVTQVTEGHAAYESV